MPQNTFDKENWMDQVLDVGRLKLTDIVWPGAHNCGMDQKAPGHTFILGNWTACQDDSFTAQLTHGARALDIRLGYSSGSTASAFYFHHNGFKSGRTLHDLIDAVTRFLDKHPGEFIVLDFHELSDGDNSFNYPLFNEVLIRELGPRLVPSENASLTIEQLKRASPRRRIVMAVPPRRELDDDVYWPRIIHRWTGSTFTGPEELRTHITNQLAEAPYRFLWSLSATGYTLLGGATRLSEHINDWFHSSRGLINRCSIINIDYFNESDLARYCWIASSEKAVYGERATEGV